MRILTVYYTHKPGGLCKRLYRLMNALAKRGHEVFYITLDKPPASLNSAVTVREIPFPTKRRSGLFFWALFTFYAPFYLAYLSLRLKPDRFFVFAAYYSSMLTLASILTSQRPILFLRSIVFKINKLTHANPIYIWFSALLDRCGIARAQKIIMLTKTMHHELEQILGRKLENVTIFANDLPQIEEQSRLTKDALRQHFSQELREVRDLENKKVILSSGVLDQRKNIGLLIEAMKIIEEKGATDFFLLVAGDGPLLERYRRTTKELGLKSIIFLGWCDDMSTLYRCCDLVLHPSLHEGMSNSVLEALAYNLPIIASDIPEHREILEYDELLFSLNNPISLAEKILNINHKKDYAKICKMTKKRSALFSFDWDEMGCKLITAE